MQPLSFRVVLVLTKVKFETKSIKKSKDLKEKKYGEKELWDLVLVKQKEKNLNREFV